jgi:hypothetical protein
MAFSYPPSTGSFVGGAGAVPYAPVAGKVFFPRTSHKEQDCDFQFAVAPIMFTVNTTINGLCFRVSSIPASTAGATNWESRLFVYTSDATTGLPKNLHTSTTRYELAPSDEEFLDDGTTPNPADGLNALGVVRSVTPIQLDANKLYWVGAACQYMAAPTGDAIQFDSNVGTGTNPLADYGIDSANLQYYTTPAGLYLPEVEDALTGANDFTDTLPATITQTGLATPFIKVGVRVQA